ncbi:hypothetical protein PspLS_08646 [Pyricularia sp. CBS 133598]|nr:hypothetical protein PspLS_08646 [Pyricularia sp. CBS 133598]
MHPFYYRAIIGQILSDRYQIVGKLGFGASSTVWLARGLELEGDSRDKLLAMMGKMLLWEASKRSSAKELANDEWIRQNM